MPASSFSRDTMAPPKGRLPTLQFLVPDELEIDHSYQRSIESGESQNLIRQIAAAWDWDLCQPLVVSRREDRFFVIDGQHRLAAARLRGDIHQLPCQVKAYPTMQAEAATFRALNDRRRPLSALDKFKAAVAEGDPDAVAMKAAIERAGLTLAPHTNWRFWEPGQVGNVGGIMSAWGTYGPQVTELALAVMAAAFRGKVLQYAGSIFPGIAPICHAGDRRAIDDHERDRLIAVLAGADQARWRSRMLVRMSEYPTLGRNNAMVEVLREALDGADIPDTMAVKGVVVSREPEPAPMPAAAPTPTTGPFGAPPDNFDKRKKGGRFCQQCDRMRMPAQVAGCSSPWCSLREGSAVNPSQERPR